MTLNLKTPRVETDFKPRITVIGVGGAGGNAVNNMIRANLEGVEFLVCNTDAQAMSHTLSERRIQLGAELTQGLGAGSRPDIGRAAAEETLDEMMQQMAGNNLVFITAGMGGGTGTGAAPVIARACREAGMLTVGVVTKPFMFEGRQRMQLAGEGIAELQQYVDTLIVIPNQNLFRVANEKTTFADAFKMADDVLFAGVRSITDLMVVPGLINLDFADIRSVMAEMGKAMMGTGEAEGDKRAIEAAEAAIANPLLEDLSIKTAQGLLINITGGQDMTLMEVDEAVNRILEETDPDADMIFGSTFDDSLQGKIRISVVATGIDASEQRQTRPTPYSVARSAPDSARVPVLAAINGAPTESPAPATLGDGPDIQADFDDEAPSDMMALMGHGTDRSDGEPAALSAQQREDAFIPPAAVAREDMGPAEPFAVAAMENGGPEKIRKKRKRSLFERMASVATGSSEDRAPRQAEFQRVEPVAGPVAPRPEPEPVRAARPEKLETIESPVRPDPADTDTDMLDIPAFLRRQAN